MTPDYFHAWQLDKARDLAPADWCLLPPGGVDLVSATLQKQQEKERYCTLPDATADQ